MSLRATILILLLTLALGHDRFAVRERAQVVLTKLHQWADLSAYLRAGPFPNEETRQRMLLVSKVRPVVAAKLTWKVIEGYDAWEAMGDRYYMIGHYADGWGVIVASGPETRDAVLEAKGLQDFDAAAAFAEGYERRHGK